LRSKIREPKLASWWYETRRTECRN